MKKFLVLYRMDMASTKEMMASMTPEKQKESMAEWSAWMQKHMEHFSDYGAPAGKNTQVSAGGVAEVSNDVGGYSIMQGESKEAVTKVLASGPHLKMSGAVADVMEILPM
jgi:hypothetical protein